MKKKNLKLNKLKVESFVTDLSKSNEQTVKGGWTPIPGSTFTIDKLCQLYSLDGFCEEYTKSICPTRDVKCNNA